MLLFSLLTQGEEQGLHIQARLTFYLQIPGTALVKISAILTINVPLILKVRQVIFVMRAKQIIGHYEGFFREGKKSRPPRKTSRKDQISVLPAYKT